MTIFFIFVSLCFAVAYSFKVIAYKRLLKKQFSHDQELSQAVQENKISKAEVELLKQTIENNEEHLKALNKNFESSFKGLAAEALDLNNKQFLELAKQNLEKESVKNQGHIEKKYQAFEQIVGPLKESLNKYQDQVQGLEVQRQKSYTRVETELQKINDLNVKLTKETSALKNALKKPHVRGRWGEVQLKNCIDLSGMSEFADVSFQTATTTSEGKRFIPDMSVRMPGDKVVYVDAKTPIDAFLRSLEATTDTEKEADMVKHGQHVKNHIKQLSSKAYAQKLKDSADFTIMFLPNESFLYAALETQADLIEFALDKKILIATPPTLIGLLKVIRYGWNEQQLSENAKVISETGTELHKRICDFVEAYINVGQFLDKAQSEYHVGMGRLESRVLTQARKLERLGAKSHKNLPEGIGQKINLVSKDRESKAIEGPSSSLT